jgi:hypothetical protein
MYVLTLWCVHMARDTDRRKFVDLATKRVRRAIKDLRLIGNLSNRSNYVYTDEDAKKIYRTLMVELNNMKARFDRKGAGEEIDFDL